MILLYLIDYLSIGERTVANVFIIVNNRSLVKVDYNEKYKEDRPAMASMDKRQIMGCIDVGYMK